TREEEAASLFSVAEWLGQVWPPLAGQARDLAGRLAALLKDLPVVDRPLHGDFYARQVLLGPQGVGLLDFDEAVRGGPALDLGLFQRATRSAWRAIRGCRSCGKLSAPPRCSGSWSSATGAWPDPLSREGPELAQGTRGACSASGRSG